MHFVCVFDYKGTNSSSVGTHALMKMRTLKLQNFTAAEWNLENKDFFCALYD